MPDLQSDSQFDKALGVLQSGVLTEEDQATLQAAVDRYSDKTGAFGPPAPLDPSGTAPPAAVTGNPTPEAGAPKNAPPAERPLYDEEGAPIDVPPPAKLYFNADLKNMSGDERYYRPPAMRPDTHAPPAAVTGNPTERYFRDRLENDYGTMWYEPHVETVEDLLRNSPEWREAIGVETYYDPDSNLTEDSPEYQRGADLLWMIEHDQAKEQGREVVRHSQVKGALDWKNEALANIGKWVGRPLLEVGLNADRAATFGLGMRAAAQLTSGQPLTSPEDGYSFAHSYPGDLTERLTAAREQAHPWLKGAGYVAGSLTPGGIPSALGRLGAGALRTAPAIVPPVGAGLASKALARAPQVAGAGAVGGLTAGIERGAEGVVDTALPWRPGEKDLPLGERVGIERDRLLQDLPLVMKFGAGMGSGGQLAADAARGGVRAMSHATPPLKDIYRSGGRPTVLGAKGSPEMQAGQRFQKATPEQLSKELEALRAELKTQSIADLSKEYRGRTVPDSARESAVGRADRIVDNLKSAFRERGVPAPERIFAARMAKVLAKESKRRMSRTFRDLGERNEELLKSARFKTTYTPQKLVDKIVEISRRSEVQPFLDDLPLKQHLRKMVTPRLVPRRGVNTVSQDEARRLLGDDVVDEAIRLERNLQENQLPEPRAADPGVTSPEIPGGTPDGIPSGSTIADSIPALRRQSAQAPESPQPGTSATENMGVALDVNPVDARQFEAIVGNIRSKAKVWQDKRYGDTGKAMWDELHQSAREGRRLWGNDWYDTKLQHDEIIRDAKQPIEELGLPAEQVDKRALDTNEKKALLGVVYGAFKRADEYRGVNKAMETLATDAQQIELLRNLRGSQAISEYREFLSAMTMGGAGIARTVLRQAQYRLLLPLADAVAGDPKSGLYNLMKKVGGELDERAMLDDLNEAAAREFGPGPRNLNEQAAMRGELEDIYSQPPAILESPLGMGRGGAARGALSTQRITERDRDAKALAIIFSVSEAIDAHEKGAKQ